MGIGCEVFWDIWGLAAKFFLGMWGLAAKGLIPRGGRGCDSQVGRGRVKGCGIEGFTKEKGELLIWIGGESHFRNIFVRSQVRSQERLSSENLSSLYSLYSLLDLPDSAALLWVEPGTVLAVESFGKLREV